MRKISIDDEGALDVTVDALRSGAIVMHPTETCYGLAVDIFNKNALKRLYRLKNMEANKPLNILVSDFEMAFGYGVFPQKAVLMARKYWPGPLSLVVPRSKELPGFFNVDDDFVSMRLSADDFSTQVVKKLGKPISSTSANKSGSPQLYFPDSIVIKRDLSDVDLLVDGGEIQKFKPSTIVKVEGDNLTLLRQGGLLCEEI